MATTDLTAPRFTTVEGARAHLERIRWPDGPVCPHCGGTDRQSRLTGASHRPGLLFCGHCRKQYSVTVGTVFERSKIPLHKWVLATHLLCSSKKGISSHQIHRTLGVTYKTAWFMTHRIREAMTPLSVPPFGQGGGKVEIDETYIGCDKSKAKPKNGPAQMNRVVALIDRDTGRAQSFVMKSIAAKKLVPTLQSKIAKEAHAVTDAAAWYKILGVVFYKHDSVNHSTGEYVSFDKPEIHTNTVEGFFSIFKRGMRGTYQHCGTQHVQRYLREFDFRYSNRIKLGIDDAQRAEIALRGISGKRLTYRRIGEQETGARG